MDMCLTDMCLMDMCLMDMCLMDMAFSPGWPLGVAAFVRIFVEKRVGAAVWRVKAGSFAGLQLLAPLQGPPEGGPWQTEAAVHV
jgi:hypothetical protein